MGFQINGDWGIYIFISFIYYQSSREKAIMIRIMATNTPNLLLKHNFISDVREFFPPRTTYSHWKVVIYFQSLFFFWPLSRQNAQSQPCVKRIDLTSKRLNNEMASKCLFRVLTLEQSFGFSPTSQIHSAVHLCTFFRIRNGTQCQAGAF